MARNPMQKFGAAMLRPSGRRPPIVGASTRGIAKAARTAPKAKASASELPMASMMPLAQPKPKKRRQPDGVLGTKNPVDYY